MVQCSVGVVFQAMLECSVVSCLRPCYNVLLVVCFRPSACWWCHSSTSGPGAMTRPS